MTWLPILFFIPFVTQAQEKPRQFQEQVSKADSINITQLINKANVLQDTFPDSTILYSGRAFKQSLGLGYAFGCGLSLANMATAYRNKGAYQRSLSIYRAAISYIRRQHYDREYYLAAANNAMFGAYFHLGMFDSAAYNCYQTIGLYEHEGNKPINPAGSIVDPLIDAYQYLAICWMQTGYLQRSLDYIQKAEQRSRSDKNQYQLLSVLTNKSSIYSCLEQPDSVIATIREARQIEAGSSNYNYDALLQINLASALLQQGHIDSAITLLQKEGSDGAGEHAVDAAFVLGAVYFQQGRYRQAIATLLPALNSARQTAQRYNMIAPYHTLAKSYDALDQYAKAYAALSVKETLEDTMMYQATQVMNMLDATLQNAKKDRQITQKQVLIHAQRYKLKQQRLWIICVTGGGFLIIVILLLLYRNTQNKRLRQAEQIKLLNKEREVQLLRAIMKGEEQERTRFARELHDGFISQLSAIRMNFSVMDYHDYASQAYTDNVKQLEDTIGELRKTAHNLMPEILLNAGLAAATQLYCERINQTHALFVDFRNYGYLPKLKPEFELPVYRMIQESVQNIIKHAGAAEAVVQFNYDAGILGIIIEDNGLGFKTDDHKTGAGLYNFRARTESLGGNFHCTSISNEGVTLYFEFDLTEHEL